MFRTANERKHLRVVAQYHLSKNWIYPEQAPARTREKLEDIDTGIIKYCGIHKGRVVKRPRKLYESAKLNNANDVFSIAVLRIDLLSTRFSQKKERQVAQASKNRMPITEMFVMASLQTTIKKQKSS